MRALDRKKIKYEAHYYGETGAVAGADVARVLGEDPARVFKTLVTVGRTGAHYVFVIPVTGELDLKKAAASVHEKSIAMIPQKELLPLTGYVHGGCSPVGMKKLYKTVIDRTAADGETLFVSAGRVGAQVELSVNDLMEVVHAELADVTD